MADVHTLDSGTVVSLFPCSAQARAWLRDNVGAEPFQWFGGSLVVEHRYADDIIQGLLDAGLTVE